MPQLPTPQPRFITLAIHTYEKAIALRALLEREGIEVQFRNVNLEQPIVASGIRVRIKETDLALALRIVENREIFAETSHAIPGNGELSVLVPVDFGPMSIKAVETAISIAARHSASVTLLYAYIDPYISGTLQLTNSRTYEAIDGKAREQLKNTALTQMRHFTTRIKEMIKKGEVAPVKIISHVMEGVPEDAICDFAKANSPYLTVMGTRGSSKKEAEMIGSVTAEVLDKCRSAVLVIPESVGSCLISSNKASNVLFFSNLEQEDILAIDALYRLHPKEHTNVTIVNVPGKKRVLIKNSTDAASLRDYCRQNFENYNFEIESISLDNILSEFHILQQDKQFDMIVLPNKRKNIFSRLFNPSLAHRILFNTDIPMLVIPV